jgi:hypothetical protein
MPTLQLDLARSIINACLAGMSTLGRLWQKILRYQAISFCADVILDVMDHSAIPAFDRNIIPTVEFNPPNQIQSESPRSSRAGSRR